MKNIINIGKNLQETSQETIIRLVNTGIGDNYKKIEKLENGTYKPNLNIYRSIPGSIRVIQERINQITDVEQRQKCQEKLNKLDKFYVETVVPRLEEEHQKIPRGKDPEKKDSLRSKIACLEKRLGKLNK